MMVFQCDKICPLFVDLLPIPSGGWLAYDSTGMSHQFVIYVDKDPVRCFGYTLFKRNSKEISIVSDCREPENIFYGIEFSVSECVPHKEFFTKIIEPRVNALIPAEEEVFRVALNIPEDKYSLIISKKGGSFQIFELTVQLPGKAIPSHDGQTILVVQNNLVTIFDNPLF